MLIIADTFRSILLPFLIVAGTVLVLLLIALMVGRAWDDYRYNHRQRVIAGMRPLVDTLLLPHASEDDITNQLAAFAPKHTALLARLLIAPARFASGSIIERLRSTAESLGLVEQWMNELSNRRWWIRAEAARALGQLGEASAMTALVATLDDDHEEVRAAGVEALGNIGDPRAVPDLVSKLSTQSRHQRVRVVEALHRFGRAAVPSLMAYEQIHPDDRAMIAELLGVIGAAEAVDDLVRWCGDDRAAVRVAAMQALGSIGLDERTYYYALRGLSSDPDADVRAMSARALGRTGRRETATYLAKHLKDEWIVAAHAATGLRTLGAAGAAALRAHASDPGTAGDLARQILFELGGEPAPVQAVAS